MTISTVLNVGRLCRGGGLKDMMPLAYRLPRRRSVSTRVSQLSGGSARSTLIGLISWMTCGSRAASHGLPAK
jgi:hypothetical protein